VEKLVIVLIAAHAVSDFFLQPDWLVKRKEKTGYLLIHALIHATVAYVALQAWMWWQAPLLILLVHAVIDAVKRRRHDTATAFVVDQVAHIAGLFMLVWGLRQFSAMPDFAGVGYQALVVAGGFIAAVQGSGFLIGKFTKKLLEENDLTLDGLVGGGKWIGQLERTLIFVFIFTGQPASIGFLVAAKSILRFEEAKKQKLAEYVLIGTLLSFSLAIALASTTKWAMNL
jgi:hypothetical protein